MTSTITEPFTEWQLASEHELLSKEEEHQLLTDYNEYGDREAFERLVACNHRLVWSRVNRMKTTCSKDDLFQEGMIGLVTAINKYDPESGNRLSTYALPWIDNFLKKYVLDHTHGVSMRAHKASRVFWNMKRKIRNLSVDWFTDAEIADIAEELEVSEDIVRSVEGTLRYGSMPHEDYHSHVDPTVEIDRRDLSAIMDCLTEEERIVVQCRLLCEPPLSASEVGSALGVHRNYVAQIQKRALEKMQKSVHQYPTRLEFKLGIYPDKEY